MQSSMDFTISASARSRQNSGVYYKDHSIMDVALNFWQHPNRSWGIALANATKCRTCVVFCTLTFSAKRLHRYFCRSVAFWIG
jgi:hypothetical protein